MSRYIDIINNAKLELKEAGIEDFETDAWLLFEHIFKCNRTWYFLHQMEEANNQEKIQDYREIVSKRCQRIPLQHLTKHQEFMGLDFMVSEHTLIPRQDTEILVEKAINVIKRSGNSAGRVLDMCTGSGCIAVSIAKYSDDVQILAADISEEALKIAEKNREKNGTEGVRFIQSDMFENIDENEKFDFIVSNPPYIKTKDIEELKEEVKLHDPFIALDGKEDGLFFYRIITDNAVKRLNNHGYLMYEIGCDQGEEVSNMMRMHGFKDIEVLKDLAGLDRVVCGRFEK